VPTVGFELTTYRLQGGCSTPELCGQRLALLLTPDKAYGAVERNRTSDLLITNQLLYQLSYNSTKSTEAQYCSNLGGGSEGLRAFCNVRVHRQLLTGVNWQYRIAIDSASKTARPEKSIPAN
jgi:hypothetical protein